MLQELLQQAAPFLPEQVGPSQASVSTNHTQVGDVTLHKVVRSFQAALVGTEIFAAGTPDDSSTLK